MTTPQTLALAQERAAAFPSLKKLGLRNKRLRPIQQSQASDCGAACLAMVLGYHGHEVASEKVRETTGVGRDGLSALAIIRAAEKYHMRGRGLSIEVEDFRYLPKGAILHWDFNHFVVFESAQGDSVTIVDPASGRRRVSLARVAKSFTGVAILLEPAEDFALVKGDRSRAWWYWRQILGQRRIMARVMTTSLLLRFFALGLPMLTAMIVDRVVPRGDGHLLTVVAVGLGAIVIFQFLTELVRSHLMLQLRTKLDTKMTLGFMSHLAELPYSFFQTRSAGDLMMRINSNVNIREILTSNTLSAVLDGVLVLGYLGLILLLSPGMAAIALTLGVLQIFIHLITKNRYQDLMSQGLEVRARSQGYLVEMLAGMETLKAAGAEHESVEHWSHLFVDDLNVSLQAGRLQAWVGAIRSALGLASPLVILLYGVTEVMDGSMRLGTMLAVNAMAMGFLVPLGGLVSSARQLQLLGSYVERIDDVLRSEPEQVASATRPDAPTLQGRVELEDVSFRYNDGGPLAVRNVSMTIEPGQTVAIVGASGSGKSTLARLLASLYQPSAGTIRFDGHNLQNTDARSIRRQLGVVTQQPYLFGSSIRGNIALSSPHCTQREVVRAARLAAIDADITAMPMGYETVLADGGASLSGGQRQRIALARALVHRPKILLLDEATSALDAETERQVASNLRSNSCTQIIVAHRLSTIRHADRIVVMAQGRIVEEGSHAELLAQGGTYATLIAAQTDSEMES